MRNMWRPCGFACLVLASLILTSGVLRAGSGTTVRVNAVVADSSVRLEARATGPFEATTHRPSGNLFVVDLLGVSLSESAGARVLRSDLVSGYRLLDRQDGAKTIVRLEVLLRSAAEPRLERRTPEDLTIVITGSVAPPPRERSAQPAEPHVTTAEVPPAPEKSPEQSGQKDQKPAAIKEVQLAEVGNQTQVSVRGTGHLEYHVLTLARPERLVLDFTRAQVRTPQRAFASNLDPVREIRVAQFSPDIARVVIDLREAARYSVSASGNAVTIAFAPTHASSGVVKPAPESTPPKVIKTQAAPIAPAPQPHTQLVAAQATRAAALSLALPANLTQPAAALASLPLRQSATSAQGAETAAAQNGNSPAQSTVPNTVKTELTPGVNQAPDQSADAKPPATPPTQNQEQQPTPPAQNQEQQPAPPTQNQEQQPAPPAGQQQANPQAPAAAPTPAPSPKYSGEPISVNLKDVDLKDFFRLIHEISGLNVVVDPAVKGNLTIVLDDVPWDQALEIVLHNNGLDKQLDGNVLRIATKETLKKEAEQQRDLAKAEAEAVPVETTTRVLSYAKADQMATTLKKFLSPRGDILADDRSNSLIIRDIPGVVPVLDNLIRQLDRKSQQVEIEARVVAANRSFSREIGTQFAFATSATHGRNIFGGASSVGTSPIFRTSPPLPVPPLVVSGGGGAGGTTTTSQMPLVTNLPTAVPTSGISYAFSSPNFALDYIITAAEAKGVGKLLSKPRVTTQNNTKATVKQGTKIPIQTIINNTISVQFIDAVLKLEVTPQITAEGTVFMDVTVENTQIDPAIPRINNIPALDTQSAETKILINDGGTVVVGGIIISSQRTDVQQVPLFGSIPLLGNLFRHTTVSSTSQELLFFLTPRILPG